MEKKLEKRILLLIIISAVILGGMETVFAKGELQNEHPGIIRFHVIANSDSQEDQSLKLHVRDYVMERLEKNLTEKIYENQTLISTGKISEAQVIENYVSENLSLIEAWAKEAIIESGYDYTCDANLGVRHIPAKYYGDVLFPEGNYKALNITIGQGKGQNWWCVVFPPLCLIDAEDSTYQDTFDVGQQDKLLLKSKIMELIDEKPQEKTSTKVISSSLFETFSHL